MLELQGLQRLHIGPIDFILEAGECEAAKYQILVLFLLAGAAGFGALAATTFAVRRATDGRDRLRLDRLVPDS